MEMETLIEMQKIYLNQSYGDAFITATLFFITSYLSSALFLHLISIPIPSKNKKIKIHIFSKQISFEIYRSFISIFIFGLIYVFLKFLVMHHCIIIKWDWSFAEIAIEFIILFIWNELHFYFSHKLFHTPFLYKNFHYIHHTSTIPTPFSMFSFHWVEAIMLGTVLLIPAIIFPFHSISLLALPIISFVLNILGHSDINVFPKKSSDHILRFAYRHSIHHKYKRGNFGFFLTSFDKFFKTSYYDK